MIPQRVRQMSDVFCGVPGLTVQRALELLYRIESHDSTVLNGLYGKEVEVKYYQEDPNRIFRQEWGVAKDATVSNPECILISGGKSGVAWAPFLRAKLIPLAHSHPFHRKTPETTRALANGGTLWDDINGTNPNQKLDERSKIFPSAGDIALCVAQNLATHLVRTPYCVCYADPQHTIRWIVNHDAHPNFGAAPRLTFRIFDGGEINRDHYRASLVAMEGDRDIWRKHDIDVLGGGSAGLRF
jgi:hypothetical protein